MNTDSIPKHPSATRRRVFLFLVFFIPSVLCLSFYYFVIREPLKNGAKIYKVLPHFGPASLSNSGDSLFFLIRNLVLLDANNELTDHTERGHERALVLLPSSEEEAKPFLAQLFRVQDKLHYLRRQFQINTVTTEFCNAKEIDRWLNNAHADRDLWTAACLKNPFPEAHFAENKGNAYLIDRHGAVRGIYDLKQLKEADRFISEAIVLAAEFGKLKKLDTNE